MEDRNPICGKDTSGGNVSGGKGRNCSKDGTLVGGSGVLQIDNDALLSLVLRALEGVRVASRTGNPRSSNCEALSGSTPPPGNQK